MKNCWGFGRNLFIPSVFLFLVIAVPGVAQQPSALLPLHIEVGPLTMLRMPSWVALNEGIYKKNGLDVDQCHSPSTLEDLHALGISPPSDMYLCSKNNAAVAASKGDTTTPAFLLNATKDAILMGGGLPSVMSQLANPKLTKRVIILSTSNVTNLPIFTRKGIDTPEQLKGGHIGIIRFTDILGFMSIVFADTMGWDPKFDVTLVEHDNPPVFDSVKNGKLDAILAIEAQEFVARQAGYKPLVDLKDWKIPMASASVNVDAEWLKGNRETARRFVKSLVEARALMERDRSVFNRTMEKYFNIKDPKLQDFFYSKLEILPRKPYPAVPGLRKAAKIYANSYPQMSQHRIEEFVDESFVRELDDSGYIDSLYK